VIVIYRALDNLAPSAVKNRLRSRNSRRTLPILGLVDQGQHGNFTVGLRQVLDSAQFG
jgi:hypothetical protein